mmetsp:Transcript_20358/g.51575  ORF Transcript_20358/g.51575 Transcript_20358/m.51575 type:complete len:337 (+) Transcript_20358:1247-2257(+)
MLPDADLPTAALLEALLSSCPICCMPLCSPSRLSLRPAVGNWPRRSAKSCRLGALPPALPLLRASYAFAGMYAPPRAASSPAQLPNGRTSLRSTTQRPTKVWLKEQPTSLFFSFITTMSDTLVQGTSTLSYCSAGGGSHCHTRSPSCSAENRHLPSGWNASARTPVVSGGVVSSRHMVSRSHTLTVLSAEDVAMRYSWGWNSRPVMLLVCVPGPPNSCTTRPVVRSWILTSPLSDPEATHLPSGLNLTCRTPDECPLHVMLASLHRMSHSLMFVSMEPDSRPKLLLKSKQVTLDLCPGSDLVTLACSKSNILMLPLTAPAATTSSLVSKQTLSTAV